jgi:hypothetical protein
MAATKLPNAISTRKMAAKISWQPFSFLKHQSQTKGEFQCTKRL